VDGFSTVRSDLDDIHRRLAALGTSLGAIEAKAVSKDVKSILHSMRELAEFQTQQWDAVLKAMRERGI
jgi:hypothetical protein